jgi:Na+-transporting NADH:ubiquinone oxidoreductase subunit C
MPGAGGDTVPPRESSGKNFAVTAAVAIACSLAVSVTAVGLRARREGAMDLDRMKNVLVVAGLYDPTLPVGHAFGRIESRWVDLETGSYVDADAVDPAVSVTLAVGEDTAAIEKRARYVQVYLVRDGGRVTQIVLPVRGQGWSMLHGFVALDRDLTTVRGLTFHEHEETAGLGAEVDNPKWKARWPGKRIFGPGGELRIRVVKGGTADPAAAYEVDGLTGASVTTEGVHNLVRFWFGDRGFGPYLARLKDKGVDR